MAALASLQRVESGAHYVSDMLFGAAIALAFALLCVGPGPLGRWFARLENATSA